MGRPVLLSLLCVCAAALAGLAPAASAAPLNLPPGAGAAPVLPPGVVPADAPVPTTHPQLPSSSRRLFPVRPLAGAAAARSAAPEPPPAWATVNICDTEKTPNGLGVRASMPGNGRKQLMFMRFTAQYWSPSQEQWVTVPGGGTSRWVYAGSARYAARQTGWTFFFEQPPAGTTFVMRAVVEQEWRDWATTASKRRAHKGAGKQSAKKHSSKRRLEKHARKHAAEKRSAKRRAQKHAAAKRVQKKHASKRHGKRKHAGKRRLRQTHASGRRGHLAVLKSRTILTKTGYEGVDGGDPVGTSKAMCLIW